MESTVVASSSVTICFHSLWRSPSLDNMVYWVPKERGRAVCMEVYPLGPEVPVILSEEYSQSCSLSPGAFWLSSLAAASYCSPTASIRSLAAKGTGPVDCVPGLRKGHLFFWSTQMPQRNSSVENGVREEPLCLCQNETQRYSTEPMPHCSYSQQLKTSSGTKALCSTDI